MRLIDADALIALIQEEKIDGQIFDIIKALQAETLNQACDRHIAIINSLPTITKENQMSEARRAFDGWWNLSTESLPKNDEYKIVTIVDERGDTPYRYVDFGFYLESANKWIVHDEARTDVVAWAIMPLPYRQERKSE